MNQNLDCPWGDTASWCPGYVSQYPFNCYTSATSRQCCGSCKLRRNGPPGMTRRFSCFKYKMEERKYVDEKGLAAILAAKGSAGVAPKLNLRIRLHAGDEACEGIQPRFEITRSPIYRGISGPTKRTDVLLNVQIILGDLFTKSLVDSSFYGQKDIAQNIFYLKVNCL